MEASPVGWLCVIPPLLTIALAIISKRVVFSLLVGIAAAILILLPTQQVYRDFVGETFTAQGYWQYIGTQFVSQIAEEHLWQSLIDSDHLRVFAFTVLLGIQVALIHRSGGMQGIVLWARPLARSRRGGQFLTWLLGLVVFIDDYANTLLLGSTMRPITDRLRISREKLAFLVDSTAAPVSGLALVSTWVATEMSTMEEGYAGANVDVGSNTLTLFVQTIPFRFYILYALAFVFLCAILGRDFGPMLRAEQKAADSEPVAPEGHAAQDQNPRALNAILPIFITVAVVIGLIAFTGKAASGVTDFPEITQWQEWGNIIGQGDSYLGLVYGAAAGLACILGLISVQGELRSNEVKQAAIAGAVHVFPALVILWLAWTLSALTGEGYLATGTFLANEISELNVPAAIMPTVIFLLASAIAFSTGTSWGTMTILMPIAIPLVYGLIANDMGGEYPAPDHYLLIASVGSVLAGAIFGDHCSPISDTTILSSRSSDCDHIAHVRTQIPYALTIGTIAVLCGTLPAGFGVKAIYLLPVGLASMVLVLLLIGRPIKTSTSEEQVAN